MNAPKKSVLEEQSSSPADVLERISRHAFHPLEDGFTKDAELNRHGIADLADRDWQVRTLAIRDQYWFAKHSPQAGYRGAIWWSHLADPAGAVGATYGAAPLAYAVHSEYINRPSTIIIDPEGIVRFAYFGTYWGDRPSIRETLEMIRKSDYTFKHPKRLEAAQ